MLFALCVLLSLTITTVADSGNVVVNGKLHHSAVLPCSARCSGVVTWTAYSRPNDILAECNQKSCRSVEGYQMMKDQYLQGDHSLIVAEAAFSRRALYVCECEGKEVCEVRLQIEPLKTPVQMKPGGSLLLDLDVPEPVEVIYYSMGEAGRSSVQLCTVDGRSVKCAPEYSARTSLALELRGMKLSDTGMYIVRDKMNEEDLHIYTVNVKDDCDSEAQNQAEEPGTAADEQLRPVCSSVPVWAWVLMGMQALIIALLVWQRWRITQTGSGSSGVNHSQNGVQMNRQRLTSTEDHQEQA